MSAIILHDTWLLKTCFYYFIWMLFRVSMSRLHKVVQDLSYISWLIINCIKNPSTGAKF